MLQVTIRYKQLFISYLYKLNAGLYGAHDGEIVLRKAKQKTKKKRDKWIGFLTGKPENVDGYIVPEWKVSIPCVS